MRSGRRLSQAPFSTRPSGGGCFSNVRTCSAPGRSSSAAPAMPSRRLARGSGPAGVVAVSSGNHAQGVAEAARLFGVRATIVMPFDAPTIKRARTERSGATVVGYDRATGDREALAAGIIRETGAVMIHPFNDPMVIAGQGTVGLEIVEDARAARIAPDAVVVPASGGGLSAGIGLAVRFGFPDCAMVLAEPEGFDDYRRSLGEGRIVSNQSTTGSVCDALLAAAPGPIGFAINRRNRSSAVAVSDARSAGGGRLCIPRAEAGRRARRCRRACRAACRPDRLPWTDGGRRPFRGQYRRGGSRSGACCRLRWPTVSPCGRIRCRFARRAGKLPPVGLFSRFRIP